MNDAKKSQQQFAVLLAEAQAKVRTGDRYYHYKTQDQTYKVLVIALREEDMEPCVVYQAEYGAKAIFIRPLANWLEVVEANGKTVPRFTKREDKS